MDDKYIRRQVLATDQIAQARVKKYINDYAASSHGHPYANYGDHIKLDVYELCPIYVVEMQTQFDRRHVREGMYPYKNIAIPNREYFRASDVPVWSFDFGEPDGFVNDEKEVEVYGSQHVETCSTCSGSGKITCPECGGRGTVPCTKCGGSGHVRCRICGGNGTNQCTACHGSGNIQKSRQERYILSDTNWDGTKMTTPTYGYRTIYESVRCSSCGGRGQNTCTSCNGTGKDTCSTCHGSGRLTCDRCHGDGKITCTTCQGHGSNVHALYLNRQLCAELDQTFFHDPRIADVAELFDKRSESVGERVFDMTGPSLQQGIFSEERELAAKLDSFIASRAGEVNGGCHILFQQADILRVDAWWVEYTYNGKHYDGVISGDRFYAGVSPITEYSDKLIKAADKAVGGTGTVKARKLLEQAEGLDVYVDRSRVQSLRELIKKHLNTLSNLGTDLMFWTIALFVTPFLYNFYNELNPVIRFAHFTNDPLWRPYAFLPAIQCVLFLVLLLLVKLVMNTTDHSRRKHLSVFGFVLSGMGQYLLFAIIVLAIVLGLNYLGVSMLTTWAGFLVWRIIRLILIVIVVAVVLLVALLKLLWKGVLWLWHLIF